VSAAGEAGTVHITELDLIFRVLVGWGLTFVLGFERAVRGAPAGDRTFSLVGAGTALIGTLSLSSPAVLGGAVTGIGFIGGGLCFRQAAQDKEILHGVTTAASIFGAAAIGAAAGVGHIWLAVIATAAVFVSLEIRHLPLFRLLDARRWQPYFHSDDHSHGHFFLRKVEQAIVCEVEGEMAAVRRSIVPSEYELDGREPAGVANAAVTTTGTATVGTGAAGAGTTGTAGANSAATTGAGATNGGAGTAAVSESVEQAIEADIMADQMIQASAAAARGGGR
jgi:putative Mg2+ transporter-C (MgtC) family protein